MSGRGRKQSTTALTYLATARSVELEADLLLIQIP